MSEKSQQKSVAPSSKIGTASSEGNESTAGPNFSLAPQSASASDAITDNTAARGLY